jgi:hypothetical protein
MKKQTVSIPWCISAFSFIKIFLFLVVTILPSLGGEMALVPVRPAELLKCFPVVEADWKITLSTAEDLSSKWPRTVAKRSYTVHGENVDPAKPPVPIATVKFILVDTAGFPATLTYFAEPKPGEEAPPGERLKLAGMPVIRNQTENGKKVAEALIKERFLFRVEVSLIPQGDEESENKKAEKLKPEDWIVKMDTNTLAKLAETKEMVSLSSRNNVEIQFIDELNPKRSNTINWSFADN